MNYPLLLGSGRKSLYAPHKLMYFYTNYISLQTLLQTEICLRKIHSKCETEVLKLTHIFLNE